MNLIQDLLSDSSDQFHKDETILQQDAAVISPFLSRDEDYNNDDLRSILNSPFLVDDYPKQAFDDFVGDYSEHKDDDNKGSAHSDTFKTLVDGDYDNYDDDEGDESLYNKIFSILRKRLDRNKLQLIEDQGETPLVGRLNVF